MNKILDNSERARYAIICFYLIVVAYAVMFVSDFMQYQLVSPGYYSYADAAANDERQLIVAMLVLGVQIALIVTFIQWFRRAYHNLHKFGEKGLVANEGWAAGAWFVPILSLFRPYQIMMDIWIRTKRVSEASAVSFSSVDYDAEDQGSTSSNALVGWWWALWIITSIGSNISYQIYQRAETVESFKISTILDMATDFTGIIAAILAIKMMKESQLDQNRFLKYAREEIKDGFVLSDSEDLLV